MRVHAYAAPAAGEPLAPTTIDRRDVGPNDVLIAIEFAGVCHSDIHTVNGDWGPQPFPVVPGHEIVGTVTGVGSDVTRHQVGDRVGVGCMVNSCGECTNCRNGDEQYCLNGMVGTYAGIDRDGTTTQGGYSTHVVVDADFVLRVPDGIDPAAAAPLLCAGITTYSPLRRWGAGPVTRVAVVGLGGLGHLAVKIAHALGAEVTVLSQSLKKQEDGLRLGVRVHGAVLADPSVHFALVGDGIGSRAIAFAFGEEICADALQAAGEGKGDGSLPGLASVEELEIIDQRPGFFLRPIAAKPIDECLEVHG